MPAPDVSDREAWLAVIERGTPAPRPQGQVVSFGDLSALVIGSELRYVCFGGREILRRVHVAVRDAVWGTIAPSSEESEVLDQRSAPTLRVRAEHRDGGLDFAWHGGAEGHDSTITYSMLGTCNGVFDFNRIGICAMLPLSEFAGADYLLEGPDGSTSGMLPDMVGPQTIVEGVYQGVCPPFERFTSRLRDGLEVTLAFAGDVFEMEDQRNWTDASFKIYSTPLSRPRPQRAEPGRVLRQTLTVSVRPV
jgi:hypothetical protein